MSSIGITPADLGAVDAAAPEARIIGSRRRRGMAIFLGLLAVLMFFSFGLGVSSGKRSTFILTAPPALHLAPLTMPARTISMAMAIVCLAVGVVLFTWRRTGGTYAIFSVGIMAFLWSFLTWAARGGELNFVALLAGTIASTTPFVFGALSGIMCERSGVINIAIEGQFLAGAFLGAMIGSWTGDLWLGTLAGALVGGLFGALLAFLALRYGADQIIVGVVIVAFCTGLTNYLDEQVLSTYQDLNNPAVFSNWAIPFLSKIPIAGPVLFDQNLFVYLAAALIVVINIGLFRTRWGLRVRAVGEHPRAADTVGLKVIGTRYSNVILGGMIAGIGGAWFTIGSVGEFSPQMTSDWGYVALAAMIFGRWRPFGALGAALLFGFSASLVNYLSLLNFGINSNFLAMAPYLITIAVVAGLVGKVRPPAADGKPYSRE